MTHFENIGIFPVRWFIFHLPFIGQQEIPLAEGALRIETSPCTVCKWMYLGFLKYITVSIERIKTHRSLGDFNIRILKNLFMPNVWLRCDAWKVSITGTISIFSSIYKRVRSCGLLILFYNNQVKLASSTIKKILVKCSMAQIWLYQNHLCSFSLRSGLSAMSRVPSSFSVSISSQVHLEFIDRNNWRFHTLFILKKTQQIQHYRLTAILFMIWFPVHTVSFGWHSLKKKKHLVYKWNNCIAENTSNQVFDHCETQGKNNWVTYR